MFPICSALRLARFNTALVSDTPPPAWTGSFFTGVPAPAGALLALMPLMVSFEIEAAWPRHALVVGIVLVVVGGLMVSRLPTFSFKKGRVPRHLVLPALLEPVVAADERIAFCAAVDENGYLPTHNRKFSEPQRPGDAAWNTANCRNRRIFNDRVGLAAGRNREPFLLQTYRRDMGGGQFVLMKDISAPITVNGRPWGGLRLAIRA